MAENDVIANQKQILQNQKSILANQSAIKANQETIKKNQASILKLSLIHISGLGTGCKVNASAASEGAGEKSGCGRRRK